jgi:hypothetical protein
MTTRTAILITDSTGRFVAERLDRGHWLVRGSTKIYGEQYTTRAAALAALAAMAARNPLESKGAKLLRISRGIAASRDAAGIKVAG